MSTSVFTEAVAHLHAATDPGERARLEWLFTEAVAGLPGLSVEEALATALSHVTRDGAPRTESLAEMREFVGALAPDARAVLHGIRADTAAVERHLPLAAQLGLRRPELLGNLWKVGLVAEVVAPGHEFADWGMISRHRQPFRNPVSPTMGIDEAWYAVALTADGISFPGAATGIFGHLVKVFVGSVPVWRWTSPEKIHRVGRSTRPDDEVATYVLTRRLGEEYRPTTRRAFRWLGRYANPAAVFDADPSGIQDPAAFKLDWAGAFRGAARAEEVLLGRTGSAEAGRGPQPLDA